MSKTSENMLKDLLAQIAALGRQIDQSGDPDAASAAIAGALQELRASVAAMDPGDDAGAAFESVTAALARVREELGAAGGADATLRGLEQALAPGSDGAGVARALDAETGGAFSRFRADNEARAMDEIRRSARANADRAAGQVKPALDFSSRLPRAAGKAGAEDKEDAS